MLFACCADYILLCLELREQGVDVVMMVVGMQRRWGAEELRQRKEFVERLARTCGNFTEADVSTRYTQLTMEIVIVYSYICSRERGH